MESGIMSKIYQNEEWLRQKIELENTPRTKIAEMCGVSEPTIAYFARKYKIVRPSSTKKEENLNNASKCKDKAWLEEQYITLNKSYDTISAEFNIGKTTIARWIKKHEIIKDTPAQFRGKRSNEKPGVDTICEHCGKTSKQKYSKVKNGYGRFCSQSCSSKFALENTGLENKLRTAQKEYMNSEKGKEMSRRNGVLAAIKFTNGYRSSIEVKMAEELSTRGIEYVEQYNLGDKFLLDFYLPEYKIVIECDGDYWHRLPKSIGRDKAKNAYVKACGLSMYRFWESEINLDVESCVDIVMKEINDLSEKASS